MKSLEQLTKIELLKIPEFTFDYFQSEIRKNLCLEFFFEKCRFIVKPDFNFITTGDSTDFEKKKLKTILSIHQDAIDKIKQYIMYSLSFYSSLLETNSFYILQNNYLIIARIIMIEGSQDFEIKLYTINKEELPKNYKDKLYLGRDFISLKTVKRDYFGILWIQKSTTQQFIRLKGRLEKLLTKKNFTFIEKEYLEDLENLAVEFSEFVRKILENLPRDISSSNVEKETLIQTNVGFRSVKHILLEMHEALLELERKMFDKNLLPSIHYVTKFKKDIANVINYIMFKVNGRISDYVNDIRI